MSLKWWTTWTPEPKGWWCGRFQVWALPASQNPFMRMHTLAQTSWWKSESHSLMSNSLWLHGLSMESIHGLHGLSIVEHTIQCATLSNHTPSMGFSRQEYWSGVPLPSLRQNSSVLVYGKLLKIKQQGTWWENGKETWEIQVKTTQRCHYSLIKVAKIKK